MTLTISIKWRYAVYLYHVLFSAVFSAIMLGVVMRNFVVLSVVAPFFSAPLLGYDTSLSDKH